MKPRVILAFSVFMLSTTFSQWYQQHTGNSRLFTVDFVNENIGWTGEIMKHFSNYRWRKFMDGT
jgi:hypothetical protein